MIATVPRVGITAVSGCLPEREVTTAELQDRVAAASGLPLPAGMFTQATGIERRRVAADDEYASDLAARAGRQALADRGLDPLDVDLLLFASATRDMVEPATATRMTVSTMPSMTGKPRGGAGSAGRDGSHAGTMMVPSGPLTENESPYSGRGRPHPEGFPS